MPEPERIDAVLTKGNEGLKDSILKSPDPHIRRYAVFMLGTEMDPEHIETLIAALGMIPGTRAVPALIIALEDEKDHVRYMAAKSLGQRRDGRAIAPLTTRMKDENEYVRNAAAKALEMIAGPPAQEWSG